MSQDTKPSVALIATVKDEAPWLLEWVAHNRAVGFDRIAVASNDCSDGTDAMLDRLAELGVLRHMRNHGDYLGLNVQFAAYQRLRLGPDIATADWLIALDADEYLNVKIGDHSVHALIASVPAEVEMVPICWRLFGDSGLCGWINQPLTEAFRMAEAETTRRAQVKSLLRGHNRIQEYGVHIPRFGENAAPDLRPSFVMADAAGRPIDPDLRDRPAQLRALHPKHRAWEVAQINHYRLKTREIFALKAARGDAAGEDRAAIRLDVDNAWEENWNEVEDLSIDATAHARQAYLAEFLADPVLRALHETAVAAARGAI